MMESKYLATSQDGKEILRILESSESSGSIELLYSRRPDAYESYQKEFGEARVFVSKNPEKTITIGTCAELIRDVYIDGKVCRSAYVCGLKKDAKQEGAVGFGFSFIKDLYRRDIDFYYYSVIDDNVKTKKMFAKKRRTISFTPFAEYKTFIINPKVKIKAPKNPFVFKRATQEDEESIIKFLNQEGRKKNLFPVVKSLNQFYNLSYNDFYLLLDGQDVVATVALWNQTGYKQYIVKRYRKLMKFARLFNWLLHALGYVKLPPENQSLNFPMLSFFVCKNDNIDYYKIMLKNIVNEIKKSYEMFVIGLHKKHFAVSIFNKLPNINFQTNLCEITFPWSDTPTKNVRDENLHPECGLL